MIPVGPTYGAGVVGGVQISVGSAQTPQQSAGLSTNVGGGVGHGPGVGADLSAGASGTKQVTFTFGAGAGGFGGGGVFQGSTVTPICTPR